MYVYIYIYIFFFELPPASLGYMGDKIPNWPMTQPISIGFLPTPSHPTAASSSLDQGFRRFPALIDALKELSQGLKIECMEMWTSFLKPAKSCLKHCKIHI